MKIKTISIMNKNKIIRNNAQGKKRTGSRFNTCSQVLILIIAMFAYVIFLRSVNAQDNLIHNCCEKTTDGEYCQFVPQDKCNSAFSVSPTECKKTDYCKLGCCIGNYGTCSANSPKTNCNGKWVEAPFCNIQECKKGCCVLGDESRFITEKGCDVKAGELGIAIDFRNEITSEVECLYLTEGETQGACVLESMDGIEKIKNCIYTTLSSCHTKKGSFYVNTFCSNPQLNTTCTSHHHTNCIEGKDEVYWFDSCGNSEDIYKECSVFSGTICGQYRPNIDSKPYLGDYVCRDLSCNVEINGKIVNKKNGESWCEYEGTIGNGNDIVGSRHVRHICYFGEERIEPCEDYRNQVCLQTNVNFNNTISSESACVVNSWLKCMDYNKETDLNKLREKCSNDSLCFIKSVYVDSYFQFDYCSPMFPPGFNAKSENSNNNGEDVCKIATQSCNIIYVKDAFGHWRCKKNCECLTEKFTEQMNDLCISLGDCGAYVNIAGGFTDDGYSVTRAPLLGGTYEESKKEYLNQPVDNFMAENAVNVWSQEWYARYGGLTLLGIGDFKEYQGYRTTIEGLGYLANNAEKDAEKEYEHSTEYWQAGPLGWWSGVGDTKKKIATFTCLPWQAPTGGDNCDLCNTNDLFGVPCSEYRCNSLGQLCEFINPRTEDEKCVKNDPYDVSSPKIKPLYKNITQGYEYKSVSDSGFEIRTNNDNCIPEYTLLEFGIETDKPARCKIGTNLTQIYDEIGEFFGGKNSFLTEHYTQLVVPSINAFENQYNLTKEQIEELGEVNYFVKCENVNGISNTVPFAIRTCVEPGPDLTAPIIKKIIPKIGYVKYGQTEKEIQIYTNEPADCRWSNEKNKKYEEMVNSFTCLNDLEEYGLYGWACNTTLTGIDADNTFYFKCKDQPWFAGTINDSDRNTMTDDYPYTLQISKTPLIIEDFRPENGKEIWSGTEPVSFELKLKTSGGIEEGKAICKWGGNGYSDYFTETNTNFHSYEITSATSGDYNIKFSCEDAAGNIAENSTGFAIKIDSQGPRVTRIFYQNGLKIITDENAECRYMFNNKLSWENATEMSGNGQVEHTAEWQLKTYYVQCGDIYGNKGKKIVIKPYSLI